MSKITAISPAPTYTERQERSANPVGRKGDGPNAGPGPIRADPRGYVSLPSFGYRRRLPRFQLRVFYIAFCFIAVLLFLNVPIPPLHTLFSPTFRLFAAILVVVGLVLNVVLYKPLLLLSASTDTRLNGMQTLMITPSGIWYRTVQSKEQTIPWQNVQAIEQDAHNLYFFLSIRGPLTRMYGTRDYLLLSKVCLIPKRAFANPLDAGTFFDAATSLWGNAHPSPKLGGTAA